MSKAGRTANYVNDLLKAYKVFFRYAFEENYTGENLTAKIRNVKKPKVIIRTFTESELKKMSNFYQGHDYLTIRNMRKDEIKKDVIKKMNLFGCAGRA